MKINCDGIIFDMDGVLIDVTKSCRLATRKTVNFYFKRAGLNIRATKDDVDKLKLIPGFNNDWNASYELAELLEKGINNKEFNKFVKPLKSSIKKNSKYLLLKEIWQIFYLGSKEFKKTEKKEPIFINKEPLRFDEKLLVSPNLLKNLIKRKLKLGIATSRPRQEAIFALKQFKLDKFFTEKYLVGQEDALREKPFPDPLIEAAKRMKIETPIYIGDTINDCLAAKKARMPGIYVGKGFLGDYQISNINRLEVIV